MFPTISPPNNDYPHFVADQLLTASALNDLFEYLDEQERLTRANLIGIGIVCGLEARLDTTGSTGIIISKGCGVTSKGYLVVYDDVVDKAQPNVKRKFTHYKKYDPFKKEDKQYELLDSSDNFDTDNYYRDLFTDNTVNPAKTMDLFELLPSAEDGATAIDTNFLSSPEKIVMVLVELKKVFNKNCDPDSCDDRGESIEVNFRFLLLNKTDADKLVAEMESGGHVTSKMPAFGTIRRFDVPATFLVASGNVFHAYIKIFNEAVNGKNLAERVEAVLGKLYTDLRPFVKDIAANDPFSGLSNEFKFLTDGSITDEELLNIQYYYDLFSDLLQAYNETGKMWSRITGMCCPPNDLFPRHLLLGKIMPAGETDKSKYRTHFIPSPAVGAQSNYVEELRSLFRRLLVMIKKFNKEAVQKNQAKKSENKQGVDTSIRITPSKLGDVPLSVKAIPFYYDIKKGNDELYHHWNFERSKWGNADQNLSYHAKQYNIDDPFVFAPLLFDLEPYNFLRIEGHVGKDYRTGLKAINKLKSENRLPFEVIALSSDLKSLFKIFTAFQSLDKGDLADAFEIMQKHGCCFSDILLLFDDIFARMLCCLHKHTKKTMDLPVKEADLPNLAIKTRFEKSKVLKRLDSDYTIAANTVGHSYFSKLESDTVNNQFCSELMGKVVADKAEPSTAMVILPYKIDKLAELIPDHITELDAKEFEVRFKDLTDTASQMKTLLGSDKVSAVLAGTRDQFVAATDLSCITCLQAELRLLFRELLLRLLRLMIRQRLGFYATTNPGIQHKAGVTMGGTFIIVYHEEPDLSFDKEGLRKMIAAFDTRSTAKATINRTGTTKQPLLSTFLIEEELKFLTEMLKEADEIDPKLKKVVEEIKEGVVIADFYLPYLCCSDCPPMQFVIAEPADSENKLPQVNAGPDKTITLPVNSVRLEGSATDFDGTIKLFEWIELNGSLPFKIATPGSAQTDVTDLVAGTYRFELTATDDMGAKARDEVIVKVRAANNPPTARINEVETITLPLSKIQLDGSSSSDPDSGESETLSFEWSIKESMPGAIPIIGNKTVKQTQVTGLTVPGTYKFTLTVKDSRGAVGTTDATVKVSAPIVKVCSDFTKTMSMITNVQVADQPNIVVFKQMFPAFEREILPLVPRLSAAISAAPTDEAKAGIFKNIVIQSSTGTLAPINMNIQQALQKWLQDLHSLAIIVSSDTGDIKERKNRIRLLVVSLYAALHHLSMYIICIQTTDFNEGAVPMDAVFRFIEAHIAKWAGNIGQFSVEQKNALKFIGDDTEQEMISVNRNGEAGRKVKYLSVLKAISNTINTMP